MFTVFTLKDLFSDGDYVEVLDVYNDSLNDVDSDAPTGIDAFSPGSIHQESYLRTFTKLQLTRLLQQNVLNKFLTKICR